MDQLRKNAREALQKDPRSFIQSGPPSLLASTRVQGDLPQLWENISSYDHSTSMDVCESLYTALCFIEANPPELMPDDSGVKKLGPRDMTAALKLFNWASQAALPSSEFAASFDDIVEVTPEIKKAQEESLLRASVALEFLSLFKAQTDVTMIIRDMGIFPQTLITMATFVSSNNPWSTILNKDRADMFLSGDFADFWNIIYKTLQDKIRPLFTKQRNPNITNEGRRDFHPVPLHRFDGSTLDDSAKPWKNTDIYATSALSWIVSLYKPTDKIHLEDHFLLLVPAILALIDDSSISFKVKGCELLGQLLKTIQESGSDILIRTNLIPVFEQAITPCLLFLPTITPEDKSLKMLNAAYPVLLALFKVASKPSKASQQQIEKGKETYNSNLAKILRSNLIISFHHISSSTLGSESSASFPHPKLSEFLMNEIAVFVNGLGIETTKYLQDIIPLLNVTLANPFGSAYPPLLLAAIWTIRAVILNAHPRIWKWRGEILSGLCACWLHVTAEIKAGTGQSDSVKQLTILTKELQRVVSVLKFTLQFPVSPEETDRAHAKQNMRAELQELVDADSELATLLSADTK